MLMREDGPVRILQGTVADVVSLLASIRNPNMCGVANAQGQHEISRFSRRGILCLLPVFLITLTIPCKGQRLSGRLLDLESNQPVTSGILTLLTPDSVLLASALTGPDGNWFLVAPQPGSYFVQARRLGYQPWVAGPLELKEGDNLESVFHLKPLAVRLDPIEVAARAATRRYLEGAGFYERQRADFGHYMTPEEIERRQATRVTDLIMGLPGVNLVSMTSGSVGARYVEFRGGGLQQGGSCRPRVFVDGLMFARGDAGPDIIEESLDVEQRLELEFRRLDNGLSLDDIGHPATIAAVEVYRSPVQVPAQFGGTSVDTQCGVIVIWTRTGRMQTAQR